MSNRIDIKDLVIIHGLLRDTEEKILEGTGHKLVLSIQETEITFSIAGVVKAVATSLNIPLSLIISDSREGNVKTARQISMYLLKQYMPEIGNAHIARSMKRDRTTVTHSIRYVKDMISTKDAAFLFKLNTADQAVQKLLNESKPH